MFCRKYCIETKHFRTKKEREHALDRGHLQAAARGVQAEARLRPAPAPSMELWERLLPPRLAGVPLKMQIKYQHMATSSLTFRNFANVLFIS